MSDERDLPRDGLRRSARLMGIPLGYAGRSAAGLGKRLAGGDKATIDEQVRAASAEQLFAVLGELKGGAMKIGQAMSLLEGALPEEQAGPYREQLRKLQAQAPPMPSARVHQVLTAELGPDWRSLFSSLSLRAAAAASIGQVHKGVWAATGEPVAVKLQYPGAEAALRSDLRALQRLSGVIQPMAGGMDVKSVTDEIAASIQLECDYTQEAAAQQQAAEAFAGDPEVTVPRVLAHTPRLIVSEWVDGVPLTAKESAPDEERNALGLRYARFLFRCAAESGLLHADPHPGNFLALPDGRLAVLDWGLAARMPDGLPVAMGRLLRLAADGDAPAMAAGLRREGFVTRDVDTAALYDYLRPFVEPAAAPEFHFTRAWMRAQLERIGQDKTSGRVVTSLNLPRSYTMIHRVWLGGVAVLCGLDCRAAFGAILDDYLPGWHA